MHMDTCSEERRRKKEEFKRKSQKEFDKTCTLEHSGKGPKRLKMATVNVRGVTGKDDGIDKTRKLLRRVNTNNLDALFVQEQNGDHSKVNEWKDMCERSGYTVASYMDYILMTQTDQGEEQQYCRVLMKI